MKKILLTTFSFLGIIASAQTITEGSHAPMNNDAIFGTYQCDSTGITAGGAGTGQSWNFSSFAPHISTLKTYTTLTSSNVAYNPADVSVSSGSTNTNYYRSYTTKLNYYGGDLTIAGITLNVKYANPAIVALYPMSLNSATTSITSGTVNSIVSGAFSGTCNLIADASGSLTLPSKTFTNVLRVVTSQTLSAPSIFNTMVYMQVYDYYCTDDTVKAPVFSINTSTISSTIGGTSTQTIVTLLKDYNVVGVNETQKSNIELSVFPNPATTVINFSTASLEATKVIAFDMTGKIVATESIEMGKSKLNTSNLATGVYMYQILDKNNQTLTTGKFNVSK